MNFEIPKKTKTILITLIIFGLLLTVIGFFGEKNHLYTTVNSDKSVDVEYNGHSDISLAQIKNKITEECNKENVKIDILDDILEGHSYSNIEKHDVDIKSEHEEPIKFRIIPNTQEHKQNNNNNNTHTVDSKHNITDIIVHAVHSIGIKDSHHSRSWSNLLINSFFFLGIGLGALFLIALQNATESAWGVATQRILEAITGYLPIGTIFIVLVFLGSTLGFNHLYHWMDPEVTNPKSEHFDMMIYNKQPFLTNWFFWLITIVFIAVYILFSRGFRKRSLEMDNNESINIHKKNYAKGAIFLVLFGYLSSVISWMWLMSIDTHWFSTLYGWYIFSGMWLSSIIFILLLIFWLKGKGYIEWVNDSHIHDLGKWFFALSFLWTYLFFAQFMLIWYANIGEEVIYYQYRFQHYKTLLWVTVAINFILPMLFLMSREAKYNKNVVLILGSILFFTHWLDIYLLVSPGTLYDHWKLGILEIGMFLFFLGIFIFAVLKSLSKAPLLIGNHPYKDESLNQHT